MNLFWVIPSDYPIKDTSEYDPKQTDLSIIFVNAQSGEKYINLEKFVGDRYDLNAWYSGNELIQGKI